MALPSPAVVGDTTSNKVHAFRIRLNKSLLNEGIGNCPLLKVAHICTHVSDLRTPSPLTSSRSVMGFQSLYLHEIHGVFFCWWWQQGALGGFSNLEA